MREVLLERGALRMDDMRWKADPFLHEVHRPVDEKR